MGMRVLGFIVYASAAAANLWPILMLAMNTAFGGLNPQSFSYIAPIIGEVVSMIFLAVAAAALLAGRTIPKVLYLIGPVLSVCMAVLLYFTSFKSSSLALSLPEAIFALGALMIGMDTHTFLEPA